MSLSAIQQLNLQTITIPQVSIPQVPTLSSVAAGLFNGDLSGEVGPTASADVVAVFDANGNQLFDLARPIKCNVSQSAKVMDHPVESGATISDFMIILPIEIELSMICTSSEYKAVFQQVKAAFLAQETVMVITKADTYDNMLIQAIPHEETPEMFNVIPVAIKLREVILVTTQYQDAPANTVANPNDQSTINSGETTPAPSTTTLAQDIKNGAVNFYNNMFNN